MADGSYGGKWINGKVIAAEGSVASIGLGTRIHQGDIGKLRSQPS